MGRDALKLTKQDLEILRLKTRLELIENRTEFKLANLIREMIDERIRENETIND